MKMMLWKYPQRRQPLSVVEVEEIKVVTKLTMASRKLKIKISNELLMELENAG
jgi:DNA polymerase-3 subunit alpha